MKDSLFAILMNFFEQSLAQLKENHCQINSEDLSSPEEGINSTSISSQSLVLRAAKTQSIRIFTEEEKLKFTKASYQFITRMLLWKVIPAESMEIILNQLLLSDSPFVTLQETKWAIRNSLAEELTAAQLVFLDLVLYQKEDQIPLH